MESQLGLVLVQNPFNHSKCTGMSKSYSNISISCDFTFRNLSYDIMDVTCL